METEDDILIPETENSEPEKLGEKGLKALQDERAKNKELQKELKALRTAQEKLSSVDVEEYEALKTLKEQAEQEKMARDQKFKELAEKKTKELTEKETAIKALTEQVQENRKKMAIQRFYYSMGGKEDNVDATTKSSFEILYDNILKSRIQLEDDGSITILSPDGLTEDIGSDGKPKTAKELIGELTESKVWGNFFEKEIIKGAGITQGVRGKGGGKDTYEEAARKAGYMK
jgi:hypothetical protein